MMKIRGEQKIDESATAPGLFEDCGEDTQLLEKKSAEKGAGPLTDLVANGIVILKA